MALEGTSFASDEQNLYRYIEGLEKGALLGVGTSKEHTMALRELHLAANHVADELIQQPLLHNQFLPQGLLSNLNGYTKQLLDNSSEYAKLLDMGRFWAENVGILIDSVMSNLLSSNGVSDSMVADLFTNLRALKSEILATQQKFVERQRQLQQVDIQATRERERERELEVASAVADAQVSGGENATAELATQFETFATKERNLMWGMRIVSAAFVGAAFWEGNHLIATSSSNLLSNQLAHLVLVVPVLVLAYFSLRESVHHREAAQRSKENALRLRTIRAYSLQLTDENREQLRFEFGQRVFNEKAAPILDADLDATDATSLLGAITALLGVANKK